MAITTSGLVINFDVSNVSCYPGTGQTVANLVTTPADGSAQTAYDFLLGSTSGAEASDPTHTTIGSSKGFVFDGGDCLTLSGAVTSFLSSMHQGNATYTIEVWVKTPPVYSASNISPLFDSGTSDQSGSDTSRGVIYADMGNYGNSNHKHQIRVKQASGGSSALSVSSDAELVADTLYMLACSMDEAGGNVSFLYRNGNYDLVAGLNTFNAHYTTPANGQAVVNKARIGCRGDATSYVPAGTEVFVVRVYNRALSKAELDANWATEKGRWFFRSALYGAYRFIGFIGVTDFLEITETQITIDSLRITGGTVSASTAPGFGSVTDLNDGSSTTYCNWAAATAMANGFWIKVAFNSPTLAEGFLLQGYNNSVRFPSGFSMEGQNANHAWVTLGVFSGFTYPLAAGTFVRKIAGIIQEALSIVKWRVSSFRSTDGAFGGTRTSISDTYEVDCLGSSPHNLVLYPRVDHRWAPGITVTVGDMIVPADPDALPHLWECTGAGPDPLAANVGFLLKCEGTQGSVAIIDSSSHNATVTVSGNAQITTGMAKWDQGAGGSSVALDGSGDYVSVPVSLNIRTGVWVMQSWVYANTATWAPFANQDNFYLNASGSTLYLGDGVTNVLSLTSHGLVTGKWQWVVVISTGSGYYYYVDGVLIAFTLTLMRNNTLTDLSLGGRPSQGVYFNGYFEDAEVTYDNRIVPGFVPPTAEYPTNSTADVLFDSVRMLIEFNGTNGSTAFTDLSPLTHTLTANGLAAVTTSSFKYGTGCLDCGSSGSNFISAAAHAALVFGVAPFAVEGWFKPSVSGDRFFYLNGVNTTGGIALAVSTSKLIFRAAGTSDLVLTITLPSTAFTHVAFVRAGNYRLIFVGGIVMARDTLSFNQTDSTVFKLGATDYSAQDTFKYYGLIDGFRITTADRYTSNIPVPVGPLGSSSATGATEPAWATTGDTTDNGITWTHRAALVDPVTLGPKVPM